MENKKILKVNCAACDARGVTEEALSGYDKVKINCAMLITNPEAQNLLTRLGASVNAASVINADEDVRVSMVNGSMELTPGQTAPEGKSLLMVNGSLELAPGCEEVLRNYVHVTVNGCVACPKSMLPLLNMMIINGSTDAYPDGCIRLGRNAVLNRAFHLRAKQDALYYASETIAALAEDINFAALAAKNVRFETKKLLVSESNAEAAAALLDERAEMEILPDGCGYVDDDAALNGALISRYGGKLFIDGDLTVDKDSAPWLEKVEYLRVDGDIVVVRSMEDRIAAMGAIYDELKVVAGSRIEEKASLTVTRALLEQAEDGLAVSDCEKVVIQEDVPVELIRERLMELSECAVVVCTAEQQPILEMIAEEVAYLGPDAEAQSQQKKTPEDENTVKINCASYTF